MSHQLGLLLNVFPSVPIDQFIVKSEDDMLYLYYQYPPSLCLHKLFVLSPRKKMILFLQLDTLQRTKEIANTCSCCNKFIRT